MRFLSGDELSSAIKGIMSGPNLRCAVAFWGAGSETLFPKGANKDIHIICNLKMGGTNPFALEEFLLPRFTVRQHDILHAKVYMNQNAAIVASANASANGLGLEGRQQAGWQEVGLFTDDSVIMRQIQRWFDSTWDASRNIDGNDIKNAKSAWRARQASKPSLNSFADFEVKTVDSPLIVWYGESDWDMNPKLKRRKDAKNLENRIENGVDIEGPEDRRALRPGTWVLSFRRTGRGLADARARLSWINVGPILGNAFRYRGERDWQAAALTAERPGREPFPLDERSFRKSFQEVMSRVEFEQLRTDDYRGAWFTRERLELMREFWRALQAHYLAGR